MFTLSFYIIQIITTYLKFLYNLTLSNENEEVVSHNEHGDTAGISGKNFQMPKHIPFPEYRLTTEIVKELVLTIFALGSAMLQLINIYHTNFWLPDSFTHNLISLHLVDRNLGWILILVMARRLLYSVFVLIGCEELEHDSEVMMQKQNCLLYSGGGFFTAIAYQVYRLTEDHNLILAFSLLYPCAVYFFLFGFEMEPFLRTAVEVDGLYINGIPVHCCRMNASQIRNEISYLRNDFNKRFKQTIFTSLMIAHYAGLVPCISASNEQYNGQKASQNILCIWMTALMLCIVFLFPGKYCDVLHRASLHLGHWQRQESTTPTTTVVVTNTAAAWCKNSIYLSNSVVKHNGLVYTSQGLITVAIPGNKTHYRFNKLFNNPANIYVILAAMQTAIIFYSIALIYGLPFFSRVEWHYQMSFGFISLTNIFCYFQVMRDFLIARRLYNVENSSSNC